MYNFIAHRWQHRMFRSLFRLFASMFYRLIIRTNRAQLSQTVAVVRRLPSFHIRLYRHRNIAIVNRIVVNTAALTKYANSCSSSRPERRTAALFTVSNSCPCSRNHLCMLTGRTAECANSWINLRTHTHAQMHVCLLARFTTCCERLSAMRVYCRCNFRQRG